MKNQIATLIADTLKDLGLPDVTVDVVAAEDAAHGDYTTNVAMKIATSQKSKVKSQKSPMDLALQVVEEVKSRKLKVKSEVGDQNIVKRGQKHSAKIAHQDILSAIDRVEAVPPGFINVFLSEASLITSLDRLLKSGEAVTTAQSSVLSPKSSGPLRIMVEFAHPNTHKAFHIGHLRNITTGESIIRLLESEGHDVIRVNYQGDVGMHIAKAMYALLKLSPYKEEVRLLSSPRTRGSSGESNSDFIKARVEFLGKAYAAGSKAFEEDAAAKEEIGYYNALIYAAAQRLAREKGIDP
ncbi:MAG: arginine--tRNA ligase, partial [Patescibacteria group bacterium]